ncbi:MAG: hypothetical protein ABI076_02705 [Acidobacteriaceae bacterium]
MKLREYFRGKRLRSIGVEGGATFDVYFGRAHTPVQVIERCSDVGIPCPFANTNGAESNLGASSSCAAARLWIHAISKRLAIEVTAELSGCDTSCVFRRLFRAARDVRREDEIGKFQKRRAGRKRLADIRMNARLCDRNSSPDIETVSWDRYKTRT